MASDTRILRRRACNKKNILNSKSIEKLHDFDCNLGRCISSFKQAGKRACFTVGRNSNNSSGIAKKEAVRRRRLKRKDTSAGQDEVSRMQKKARYLLIKMKLEQNLIDAYSGDGWKGQSREKIKPEKELQRAQRQIMKCKLGIRDSIHHLDLLGSEGRIDDSVMHPDGSVFHEYIFCAKCKSREAFSDNDIILCDGNCNCGFHQKCLDPPLEKIPPGDQGWLCRICNCKVEILETLNAHLGTCFTVNDSWEEIFKEAVASYDTEGGCPNLAEDWPSDDSEDEDYCPDITNNTAEFEENISQDACCSTDSIFSFDPSLNFISYSGSDKSCNETSRRQRRDVDYTKLYCEMFGKGPDELKESEDEDWGPYRKKKTRNASDIGIALSDGKGKDIHEKMALPAKTSCNKRSFISILPNAIEAEVVNDPHRGSDISMENQGHRHILDEGASSDSSSLLPLASVFRLPRHKKRAHRAENTTRATFPVKKQEGTATTVGSTAFKVASQLTTNTMFLEKQTNATVKMLAAKNVSDEEELFLNEMQMICSLDRRLHYLKQRLLACKVNTEVQINLSGEDGDIVYVPVAEIKEKILR